MGFHLGTFGLELLNVVILAALLARFLFRPVREVMARREREVRERLDRADEKERAADALKAELEAARSAASAEREALLRGAREEAAAERRRALAETGAACERRREEAARRVERERARALQALQREVVGAASHAAGALLQALLGRSVGDVMAERLAEALEGEGEEERTRLERVAAESGARLVICGSLGETARARLDAALEALGIDPGAVEVRERSPDEDPGARGVVLEVGPTVFDATLGRLVDGMRAEAEAQLAEARP